MTEENTELDRLDRVIIGELVSDGRLSFRELGERVGLSANAAAERVRRLLAEGIIRGFHADVNPATLGLRFHVFVDLKTGAKTGPDQLAKVLRDIPEVRRAFWTTGAYDFTLELNCKDQEDLVRLVETLRKRAGILETYTRLIGREFALRSGSAYREPKLAARGR
jgi:Lrp/AsnC family leucine-responsive transcriptional regulator